MADCNSCGDTLVLLVNWTEAQELKKNYSCSSCRKQKQREYYQKTKRHHNQRNKEYYERNKEAILATQKAKYLWDTFRVTPSEYKYILQDPCYLCGADEDKVLDHCHTTGEVRGVLCRQCNQALGLFKDNLETLENAIIYLRGEYA